VVLHVLPQSTAQHSMEHSTRACFSSSCFWHSSRLVFSLYSQGNSPAQHSTEHSTLACLSSSCFWHSRRLVFSLYSPTASFKRATSPATALLNTLRSLCTSLRYLHSHTTSSCRATSLPHAELQHFLFQSCITSSCKATSHPLAELAASPANLHQCLLLVVAANGHISYAAPLRCLQSHITSSC